MGLARPAPFFCQPAAQALIGRGEENKIKAQFQKFYRSFGNSIRLDVTGGYVKEGDEIVVTMGDTPAEGAASTAPTDGHAYWVRVLQSNGNAAWSSPIFVK